MNKSREHATVWISILVERSFAIVMLFTFTGGLTVLVWRYSGWGVAIAVFALSMWIWLPGFRRAWQSIGRPELIDAHSLFGASFECPCCGRVRYHTLPCLCGHRVNKLEWEHGQIKSVE